jgi:uncharacterized protein (DUF305 family)
MKRAPKRTIAVAAGLVVIAVAAVFLFSPMIGRARLGPMGDMPMGPMSFGMMRQSHAMADVESEYQYMVRMVPHHQEAVENARVLLERTRRSEMQAFAERIIETQTREIEEMQTWLDEWYPERRSTYDYTPMMGDYSGMSGDELDLAFLQDMIPHHMAAVMMSQRLLSRVPVEHRQLARLADTIRDTQSREIEQMSLWLDRWFG